MCHIESLCFYCIVYVLFEGYGDHRDLHVLTHPFPTRRSSDLKALNSLDIGGRVVIGEGERDEAPMLYIGEEVGTGDGPKIDIALDPLEGTTITAKEIGRAHV